MELLALKAIKDYQAHKDFKGLMVQWVRRVQDLKALKVSRVIQDLKALKVSRVTLVLQARKDFKDRKDLLVTLVLKVHKDRWVRKEPGHKARKVDKGLAVQQDLRVRKGFKVLKAL